MVGGRFTLAGNAMNETPMVSVVLPTYNRAKTLARALDSVLAQTWQDFEVIVVVDPAPDDTAAVLARYAGQPKMRVLTSSRGSCAAARNLGVAASSSPYVAFQDSDDEWLPTFLEQAVCGLAGAGKEVGVCYTDMIRGLADGRTLPFVSPEIARGAFINAATLDYQVYGLGIQATLIKRECLLQVGGFDEALPRFVDLELFLRLAERFEFVHHREALVRYCEHEGISTNARALVVAREHLLRKYQRRLREHLPHLAMQHLLLSLACNANGEKLKSARHAFHAWRLAPRHPQVGSRALQQLRRRLRFR